LRLKKEPFKNLKELLEKMENANFQDEAIEFIRSHHPHFVEEIRSRLKSTNASENLHKELEKILFAKWAIFIKNLHSRKWLRPEPYFKAHLESLHLLFQHTFQSYEIKNEKNLYIKLTQNY